MDTQINLSKFGRILSQRMLASQISSEVLKENPNKVILNFEGVSDVTPSFLHEIIIRLLDEQEIVCVASMKNATEHVQFQLPKVLSLLSPEERVRVLIEN